MYWIKRKIRQIKNLFRYIPVIWKSYDFDYHYAVDIFKMHLEDLANMMESDRAMTVSANDNAKKIRTAIKLIDKVYNEEYACEYQKQIEDIYGKSSFEFVELEKTKDKPDKHKLYSMIEVFEKEYSKKELDNIEIHKTQLFHKSQEKQEKAHRILWEFISHNIRSWWD